MNPRQHVAVLLISVTFISWPVLNGWAQEKEPPPTTQAAPGKEPTDADPTGEEDPPLEITSDRMRAENGGEKIIFSGNVVSVKGDIRMTSDILEIYNSEDKKDTDEIVAIGNVHITRGEKRAKGDRAVYLDKLQKIILTGTPKAVAWEGKDIIEGREMIFLLEKDRFVVNERVHVTIFPKEEKKKAKQGSSEKKNLS